MTNQPYEARLVGADGVVYTLRTVASNKNIARKNIAFNRQDQTDVIVDIRCLSWKIKNAK